MSLVVRPGEIVCVVGESGSGKTQLLLSLLDLQAPGAKLSGARRFAGAPFDVPRSRAMRGDRIAMLFQDPATAFNPCLPLGTQLTEALVWHQRVGSAAAEARAIQTLEATGLADAPRLLGAYPHELSGGMRQRVMLAMAVMTQPQLLLADEPTTALDLTTQARVLDLLLELRDQQGMAILLVTHDLGVVARIADRVAVMHGGRIVEQGDVQQVLTAPLAPYTRGLVATARQLEQGGTS